MKPIRAVVFDVGETLVNERRSWSLWADWLGVPDHVLFATLGAVIAAGQHHHRVFDLLQPGFDLARARAERLAAGTPDRVMPADLYPDASSCLRELRIRGLRVGIAGNQPEDCEDALRQAGLAVDLLASSARWGVEKPSPTFFARIAAALHLDPQSIAYVGDRLDNDVLPAIDAGMLAIFLRRGPWGFLHAERPEAACAHLRIDSLDQLPAALKPWC